MEKELCGRTFHIKEVFQKIQKQVLSSSLKLFKTFFQRTSNNTNNLKPNQLN